MMERRLLNVYYAKSFECQFCDFKFVKKATLMMHVESIHQNSKPFDCAMCNEKFSRKGIMKKHFREVHEGKKLLK